MKGLLPIDNNKLQSETCKGVMLGRVFNFIRYGFSKETNDVTKPYKFRQNELSIGYGIIMWSFRVVVPKSVRSQFLKELHSKQEGISKMKANAWSYFWWPSLNSEIEKWAKNCDICMLMRPEPKKKKTILNLVTTLLIFMGVYMQIFWGQ